MSQAKLLHDYTRECNNIRVFAKRSNLTDDEINECYAASLRIVQSLKNERKTSFCKIFNACGLFAIILVIIYALLNFHQPTSSFILRNVQTFIYPGFKLIRFLSLPIISLFPSLTALYDESCLVENPYFQVTNLDCFPCQDVRSVINLTDLPDAALYDTGRPFVTLDVATHPAVKMDDLRRVFIANEEVFQKDAPKIVSNDARITVSKDLMEMESFEKDLHVLWRINRMDPARILRKLFPRPRFITEWSGQCIERFIFIDGPQSDGYLIPGFECSYVFIIQGSGQRNIMLKPTKECSKDCRTVSIELRPSNVLLYNWWFWKPLSLPSENSTDISVTYISSYS